MAGPTHMAGNTCHGLDEGELQVAVRDLLRQETLIIRGELTEPPTWFPSFRELTFDGAWLQSLNLEFLALGIDRALVYEDTRVGDHCADLRDQLEHPHKDIVIGEVRFTTTEHFGIRFGMCWNWMQREIIFSIRHSELAFALVNNFQIGPASEEKCQ